jgi:ABC-type multidrug transport system fused ATPase/permease subunit
MILDKNIRQWQIHIAVAFQCISILVLLIGGCMLLLHHLQSMNSDDGHDNNNNTSFARRTTTVSSTTTVTSLQYFNNSSFCTNEHELLSNLLLLQHLFQQLMGGVLISLAIGTGFLLLPILHDIRTSSSTSTGSTTSNTCTNPNPSRTATTTTTATSTTNMSDSVRNTASYCHYGSTMTTLIFALGVIVMTMMVDSKWTAHNNNNNYDDDSRSNHTTVINTTTSTFIRYYQEYTMVQNNDTIHTHDLSYICDLLLFMGMGILLLSSTSFMITFWPAAPTTPLRSYARDVVVATSTAAIHNVENESGTSPVLDPLRTPLLMEYVNDTTECQNNNTNNSGANDDDDIHSSVENGTCTLSSTNGDIGTTMDAIVSQQPPPSEPQEITTSTTIKVSATRRLLQLASSQIVYLYMGCIVLLVRLPFSLAIPHFVSTTLSAVASSHFTSAHQEIQWLFIAGTIDAILDFWAFFLFGYANQRIVRKLRIDLFTRLLCQEVAFFDIHSSGELSSRLNSDCGEMAGDLTWFFRFSIESVVRITGITVYMMLRCPMLGTCAISIIPAVAIINKSYGDWLHRNSKKVQDALADANIVAQEALSNIRTVISFVTESQECERYENRIERQYQLNIQQLFMTALYYMVVSTFLINTMVQGALLWVGSILIERDALTPGILLAFMLYQSQLQNEVLSLMNSYTSLIKSSGAGDKVFALIDRQPPQPSTASYSVGPHPNRVMESNPAESNNSSNVNERCLNGDSDIHHTDHLIRHANTMDHFSFENITFAYPSRPEQVILDGLNLTIPKGQTVALVGTSGGGKTTIMNLLQRFYDPCLGQLLIYGNDLRTVDVMAHRKEIGIVTQDPILFQGTIRDNITYGCLVPDQVREEHVVHAAQLAHAHSFILSFPDGYDTMIGERGVQLSGGQKQRIGT